MGYDIKKLDKSIRVITLKAEDNVWKAAVTKSYNKTKGEYNIKGFRKGFAPRSVIEQNYGKSVFWDEAVNALVNDCYYEVLHKDDTFNPVEPPKVEVVRVDDSGMEATITVACLPEFKLGKYKGIEIQRVKANVTDKDVDEEIERGRQHFATIQEVKRASKLNDIVTIDFVGFIDGKKFDGGAASDHKLELGSKSFIDGFEDQLIGKKVGDKVTVKVTFPKDYGAEALAGKKAEFKVEVKAVSEKVLPELDLEFTKKIGEFADVAAYKEDVRAQLVKVAEDDAKARTDNMLIEKVVEGTDLEAPKALIEEQQDAIMKDLEYKLMYQGLNLEGYASYMNTTVEGLRADRAKDAKAIAKTKLVLEALIKAENLKVSQAELDAELTEFAKKSDKTLEEYKKIIKPQQIDYMANDILMKKLIEMLYKLNKVVD